MDWITVLVGRNVRRIRLEKGLTQRSWPRHRSYPQQYLSELERGVRTPPWSTPGQIAHALSVASTILITLEEEAQEE